MRRLILTALILLALACATLIHPTPVIQVYAASLPATLHATWTPNPAADNVVDYILTVDGVAQAPTLPAACTATLCTTAFSVNAWGSHTATVVAQNLDLSGTGTTGTLQSSPPSTAVTFLLSNTPVAPSAPGIQH